MGSEGTEVPGPGGPGTLSPPRLLTEPCCLPSLQLAPGVNSGQGLGIEIIGTLQLVLCVLATTDRRRRDLGGSGPLAIGLSVALGHLLAVSVGSSRVGMGRTGPGTLSWAGVRGTGSCSERAAQGPPDHLSGSVCPPLSGSDCHLLVFSLCVSVSPLPVSASLPPLASCPCPCRSTTQAAVSTPPGPSAPR